jgi:hypothetical protein
MQVLLQHPREHARMVRQRPVVLLRKFRDLSAALLDELAARRYPAVEVVGEQLEERAANSAYNGAGGE